MLSSCRDWRTFRTSGIAFSVVVGIAVLSSCEPDLDSLTAGGGVSGRGGGGAPGGGMAGSSAGGRGGSGAMGGDAPVPTPQCMDGVQGAGETDVDCGGDTACARCPLERKCVGNGDCASGFCYKKQCLEPLCDDQVQNGDETDLDCGGSCSPCPEEFGCSVNADCVTEYCSRDKVCVNHCVSGRQESDETDEDCGGATCDPCPDDAKCVEGRDCESGNCSDGICLPQSCSDGVRNQGETDIDCGGTCAQTQPCGDDKDCESAADCISYICTDEKCQADVVIGDDDRIDYLEDGDTVLEPRGGRVGTWYSFSDGKGTATTRNDPIEGRRGTSEWAMHTAGMGFNQWGSGIGFDLNNTGTKKVYDASQYAGITFWGRAAADIPLRVVVPEHRTTPGFDQCTACDHHFLSTVTLTSDWRRHIVCFADLLQESGGDPVLETIDTENLVSIQFRVDPNAIYDFWIDDVAFLTECGQ